MIIKNLTLQNFRNYESERFDYGEGLNIVFGNNAQGKTNSAEAIFMLCTGYSPRVKRDKQVIRYGEQQAYIAAEAESRLGTVKVDTTFYASSRKRVSINGIPISKIGELFGNINSVFFSPSTLRLVQESPEDRRRFMDVSLSQMNKRYFYALKKYNDVLSHRNSLLKSNDRRLINETIGLWDVQLAEAAGTVVSERSAFLEKLAPLAEKFQSEITGGREKLSVEAENKYGSTDEEISANLLKALSERLERDIILGYTTAGPHRDDIKITLDGEDVRAFGSQGQQRTAALALKIAELEIFKLRFGEYPVLILDDAMSELDEGRKKRLLKLTRGVQTIVTCTRLDDAAFFGEDYSAFSIDGGKATRL